MSDVAVVIVAAGKSTRFTGESENHPTQLKKPFVSVRSRALWLHSVDRFLRREDVKQLILVIAEEDQQMFQERFGAEVAILSVDVVLGGSSRAESVLHGLRAVRKEIAFVAVHDAARPCIADTWLDQLFAQARETGAAILATPVVSTVKRVIDDSVDVTVSREGLWESQTPQMFEKKKLLEAYKHSDNYVQATDEAQLMEWLGHNVAVVPASPLNRKVTTQADLQFVEIALDLLPKKEIESPSPSLDENGFWN